MKIRSVQLQVCAFSCEIKIRAVIDDIRFSEKYHFEASSGKPTLPQRLGSNLFEESERHEHKVTRKINHRCRKIIIFEEVSAAVHQGFHDF
jgi:hypothetical protein